LIHLNPALRGLIDLKERPCETSIVAGAILACGEEQGQAMDEKIETAPARVTAKVDRWLEAVEPATPCIVVDVDVVRAQYQALAAAFPFAEIFYAVKANPAPEVIATLAGLGVGFDLASEGEIARCLTLGLRGTRLSFGNTIKRESDIAHAHQHGVRLYAFDSQAELEKIARAAPGAEVFCRLAVAGGGAEWPLTRKFGCHAEMAIHLLLQAKKLGLKPTGVSFHVGSQQTDPETWQPAIDIAADVFRHCRKGGVALELVNLGGGFPAQYRHRLPPIARYAEIIEAALRHAFGEAPPRIIIEPGRYLVGDAGLLRARVVLIAQKSRHARHRWVYLDAGRYNGLAETLDERIQYRLRSLGEGLPMGPVILAGPSCDSTDILYQRADYQLPLDLAIGDPIDFLSAGAYSASYASVEFNGFPPIRLYCI
jgi:ornithine decarboxylase